jgi:thiamine biosynthesis lipoprotein
MKLLLKLWLSFVFLSMSACTYKTQLKAQQFAFELFGAPLNIQVLLPSQSPKIEPKDLEKKLEHLVWEYKNILVDSDEINQFNMAMQQGQAYKVKNPKLLSLIVQAKKAEIFTRGWFNPSLGKISQAWGLYYEPFALQIPSEHQIKIWQQQSLGLQNLRIQSSIITSPYSMPDFSLDLGGIIKGIVLDDISLLLQKLSINNTLINFGGNIKVLGNNNGRPWRIALRHPRLNQIMAIINLYDQEALGTSGDYQRYVDFQGKRYCHIINPINLSALCSAWAATVLIPAGQNSGMYSDILSKPLFFVEARSAEPILQAYTNLWLKMDAQYLQLSQQLNTRIEWKMDLHPQVLHFAPP